MIHKMFYNGNGKKNSKIRVQEQRRRNYCSSSDVVRRYGCSGRRHCNQMSNMNGHRPRESAHTSCVTNEGNSFFASSSVREGCTTTSSPFFQFEGVITLCLSVVRSAVYESQGRATNVMSHCLCAPSMILRALTI